ncbi:MAG: hypothetical protein COX14_04720 [Chloroflexi bacterium CG23_combo_of_CG06-09_8_20_14_all_45_10]|nr:MAG: hypothetical protein COX14_04720 [Chloroflexi bacterium CG23_combo_of_CG06-09_8_20_14_all_45_10]
MPQDVTRELAALVAIVSIALAGTTIVLLPPAWRGFEERFLKLPSIERKTVIRNTFILLCPILILVGTETAIGVYWPDLVQAAVFLVMLLLAAIAILSIPVVLILRRIRKTQKPRKPDELSLLYFTALIFLTLCIMCSLFALIGVTPTMLMIEIGPYGPEDFNWGRWMLQDGVFFLVCGIWMLGFAYVDDRTRLWKAKKSPDEPSNPNV